MIFDQIKNDGNNFEEEKAQTNYWVFGRANLVDKSGFYVGDEVHWMID